jgi:2-keto-4-pentenoate hydratase/2-oxohepta-3-ene-1,7-dioic acid hydratase in catechol pathway
MKIASFFAAGRERFGVWTEAGMIDLSHPRDTSSSPEPDRPTSVLELIEAGSKRYKGRDTFACVGPWIVTKDEIPDPHTLRVTCRHGDSLVTDDNTENLFFKVPELLQFISRYVTPEPGDIVSLGTALRKSIRGSAVQNIDLNRLGGPISITIDGIGTLTNTVVHLDS